MFMCFQLGSFKGLTAGEEQASESEPLNFTSPLSVEVLEADLTAILESQ